MDLNDQIEAIAEERHTQHDIIDSFRNEAVDTCRGYCLVWVDEKGELRHSRWNMHPWEVRGAFFEVLSWLDADNVE